MNYIYLLAGIVFIGIGLLNITNAKAKAERDPNTTAKSWRISGAICLVMGVIIVGLASWMLTWNA